MTTLADILLAPGRRDTLVQQTAAWIERHTAGRSGLRGLTLRAALGAAKAARPDVVERAVARLLPEFARALEPMWQRFRATGEKDFGAYLERHRKAAAATLMEVADARAAASTNAAAKAAYKRLRGTFEHELAELLPAFAQMVAGMSSRA